jgi:hypothetical protein
MDVKTGKIYEIEAEQKSDLETELKSRLEMLTEKEYATVKAFKEEHRPRELALQRFLSLKKDVRGMDKSRIMFAFRVGYDAAKYDLTGKMPET